MMKTELLDAMTPGPSDPPSNTRIMTRLGVQAAAIIHNNAMPIANGCCVWREIAASQMPMVQIFNGACVSNASHVNAQHMASI